MEIFTKIAAVLNITSRWAGEEPLSQVTRLYNRVMEEKLPEAGIQFVELPRVQASGTVISASTVRVCLKNGDFGPLEWMLPSTTLAYLKSREAEPVLAKIRSAENVVHD